MLLPKSDNPLVFNNKTKKQTHQAVLASVKQEMAEPRVAESAQVEQVEPDRQSAATLKEAAKT